MSSESSPKPPVLISACLLGLACRYDGKAKGDERLRSLAASGRLLPVCPEQLGGLSTPRPPVEIVEGTGEDVLEGRAHLRDDQGRDRTEAFLQGARQTLAMARLAGCRRAVLKERSPSCGTRFLKSLGGEQREGRGVTAALLLREGLQLRSEESENLEAWLDED